MRKMILYFHMLSGVTVGSYFYSPLKDVEGVLAFFQYGLLPAVALSGLYLWKGHLLKKRLQRRSS